MSNFWFGSFYRIWAFTARFLYLNIQNSPKDSSKFKILSRMPAVCYTFHLSRRAKRTKCDALSIFDIFFLKTRRSFVSFVSKKRIHVIRDIVHPTQSGWHDQCDFWCQGCRPSVTRFICRAYRRYLLIGQREQNVMCLSAVLSTHVTRCDRSRVLVFLYWCGNQPRTYVL